MKNYINIKILLIAVLTSLIQISCDNNVEEETSAEIIECNSEVSFSAQVKPIIDNRCVECHNGNRFPDLRNIQSISASAAQIRSAVVSRRMPQGSSLSSEQIEIIRCWIDGGALNN